MQNIKHLLNIKSDLESRLKNLNSTMTNNDDLVLGTYSNRIPFSPNDEDILDLISLKIDKLNEQLKPIIDRLNILDELAAESIRGSDNETR